jgi:hypothetical protein
VLWWKEEMTTPRPTVDMTEMSYANKGSPKILDHLPTQKKTVLSPGKRRDELDSPPSEQDKSDKMLNLKGSKPKPETKNVQLC